MIHLKKAAAESIVRGNRLRQSPDFPDSPDELYFFEFVH